jgi:type IV fimbrial biogenesis protein FimT
VLALAAVILGIGVPNFRDFQRNNRLTVAANDVLGIILSSRGEALRRQVTISLCRTDAPDEDDAGCNAGTGWIAFEDANGDCVRDAGEELVGNIRVDTDVNTQSNTGCMSFATNGFKRPIAGQPGIARMVYCDSRRNVARNAGGTDSTARGIEVLPTGRGTVVKDVAELTSWEAGGEGVRCP